MAESSPSIQVQVAYALPDEQTLIDLTLPAGSTVMDAIVASGIVKQYPEIDLDHVKVGIYARKKTLDFVLREHDRVEIYRPLVADPKEARRRRVAKDA